MLCISTLSTCQQTTNVCKNSLQSFYKLETQVPISNEFTFLEDDFCEGVQDASQDSSFRLMRFGISHKLNRFCDSLHIEVRLIGDYLSNERVSYCRGYNFVMEEKIRMKFRIELPDRESAYNKGIGDPNFFNTSKTSLLPQTLSASVVAAIRTTLN
ncbi:hypothetical protein QNI16_27730 [Cytophagaceae bacterium YF14B1]|uniref:Uncharacterized protein n=1 Tax=Xanthocytophaga flava TaxID=3048013 RepID=A0AAE3U8S0_9BACT|nr:hypothetical protein [Xanthocytophaga flavus]MDJ1484319.1 hypothetical protein [Xanthocytophaga flavus]